MIAFGGGSSVHENPLHFARIQDALRPFPYVLLLLPSPDPAAALEILTRRLRQDRPRNDAEAAGEREFGAINRMFLEHPSNARLATHTVITAGRTPEQVSRELAALIRTGDRLP